MRAVPAVSPDLSPPLTAALFFTRYPFHYFLTLFLDRVSYLYDAFIKDILASVILYHFGRVIALIYSHSVGQKLDGAY